MALHDHFRPPLAARRHWQAVYSAWATFLASDLNARLPEGYFAEPAVQYGIEIDVAVIDEESSAGALGNDVGGGGVATQTAPAWAPPEPIQSIPFTAASDSVEILVFDSREGPTLAGAIELVSPANKDRPASRGAFVSKCETYLQSGVGVVIVDVVTDRQADLHQELLNRLSPAPLPPSAADLYAAAYRAVERDGQPRLDIWHQLLQVGQALPTIPLWLKGGPCLPADLAATYDRTCREQRIFTIPQAG